MVSPTFTPVPATRMVGTVDPPGDMNNTSNELAAIGAGYSVMNTVYGGGADPTGVTISTAQIGSAIAAGHANGMPVLFPAGTFSVDAALNWKLPGLQVIGAGSGNTKILQKTANTPIIQVAGQGQLIQGMTLAYGSQQASGQTSANNIQFGDDTVGSCFESAFKDLYCQLGYTPLTVSPALVTSAGLFSCLFENIHVLGYYQHAIGLAGNAGGGNSNCTGCVWNNTYVHNNFSGSATAANSFPVFLESWDEIVFNQLNIEHGESFIEDLIGLAAVGNCVINGLHIESMQLSGANGNAAYINCDSKSGVIVNGLSARFSTMSGTVSNSAVRFSGSTPSAATITGYNEPSDNTFSHAHAYADFGTVSSCTAQVSNVLVSQTTVNTLNQGAGDYFQVGPPQTYSSIFGDGSDGSATLDGTATVSWASKSSSTYTMTRDCYCTSLTINSGVTLKPAGYRIFCYGPVVNAGTITTAGNAGSGSTAGGSTGSGTVFGGRPGGAGTTTVGSNGTNSSVGLGAAGAGGAGTSGAGGTGGSSVTTTTSFFRLPLTVLNGWVPVTFDGNANAFTGGGGGGGGGGDGSNAGGGGGSGGGAVIIFAFSVVNTGTITTAGGAGASPAAGNTGGGGGGTGGPILIYTLTAWTAGTTTTTAGTFGTAHGAGSSNGSAGSAGLVMNVLVL